MNKDPEMQGNATQPNQDSQTTQTANADSGGQEVVLGPEDNVVVAEATLETKLSDGSVVETTVVPKKKKHTGLIVTIVVFAVLLLAGVGLALWYFLCFSNPERVAYDAIDGLFKQNSLVSTANFSGIIKNEEADFRLSVSVDANAAGASSSSNIAMELTPVDANGQPISSQVYKFKISNVVISDGVFYIRTEDLAKTIKDLMTDVAIEEGNQEVVAMLKDMISEVLSTVDDEWWQISVPDIIDMLAEGSPEAEPAKELYACMVNIVNQDSKGELASLYGNNRFITVKKSNATDASMEKGLAVYSVGFDYDKMAGFVNAIPNSTVANNIYSCYNKYLDSIDSEKERISAALAETVTADDLRKEFSTEGINIWMGVDAWSHQLKAITAKSTVEGEDGFLTANFIYQDVEVKAPEDYRPVTELIEDITNIIMQAIGSQYGSDYEYDPLTGTFYSAEEPWADWDDTSLPINDEDDWNA